jgi:hypothetical protein
MLSLFGGKTMKLIEALKKVKDLLKKADDLRDKISKHCSDLDCETPVYSDQKEQVSSWLQAHSDILKEISSLQYRILKTNVLTKVTVELGGKFIEKSISEWMGRRKKLANMEEMCWRALTDRNLREGNITQSNGTTLMVKIRRHYDPKLRDEKVALYSSEPSLIDAKLEIANCMTDLLD